MWKLTSARAIIIIIINFKEGSGRHRSIIIIIIIINFKVGMWGNKLYNYISLSLCSYVIARHSMRMPRYETRLVMYENALAWKQNTCVREDETDSVNHSFTQTPVGIFLNVCMVE